MSRFKPRHERFLSWNTRSCQRLPAGIGIVDEIKGAIIGRPRQSGEIGQAVDVLAQGGALVPPLHCSTRRWSLKKVTSSVLTPSLRPSLSYILTALLAMAWRMRVLKSLPISPLLAAVSLRPRKAATYAVNASADDLIMERRKLDLAVGQDVCGILGLHDAPVIAGTGPEGGGAERPGPAVRVSKPPESRWASSMSSIAMNALSSRVWSIPVHMAW